MNETILSESQLRSVVYNTIAETLEANPQLRESIFSRIGNAWDNVKQGNFGDIKNDWKMEKAEELFTKYRDLLTKANQFKPQATRKAAAVGTNYQGAKAYAQNGYRPTQQPAPQPAMNESEDETFIGGVRSTANNVMNNVRNNGLKGAFNGAGQAYRMGDAAGDAQKYNNLMAQANAAKRTFLAYCQQNGLDPQAVATNYDRSARYDTVTGANRDRINTRHATQNSQINRQMSTAGNTKDFKGAGVDNSQWTARSQARRQTAAKVNNSNMWGAAGLKESQIEAIVAEAIKKVLK